MSDGPDDEPEESPRLLCGHPVDGHADGEQESDTDGGGREQGRLEPSAVPEGAQLGFLASGELTATFNEEIHTVDVGPHVRRLIQSYHRQRRGADR